MREKREEYNTWQAKKNGTSNLIIEEDMKKGGLVGWKISMSNKRIERKTDADIGVEW